MLELVAVGVEAGVVVVGVLLVLIQLVRCYFVRGQMQVRQYHLWMMY